METKERNAMRNMVLAGVFAALIFLTTAYLFHIPVGGNGGYVHFGDSMVYLAASLLPAPYAMAAGAIGAGLSDLLSPGGAVWILPTVIIKPLMTIGFRRHGGRLLSVRNLGALALGSLINTIGYLAAGFFITGGWGGPIAELPSSLAQFLGSAAFYFLCAAALDKAGLGSRLFSQYQQRG